MILCRWEYIRKGSEHLIYTNSKDFVKLYKIKMIEKDIKQKDIVEKTGLSHSTTSNYLAGKHENMTINTFVKLCDAIDCALEVDIVEKQSNTKETPLPIKKMCKILRESKRDIAAIIKKNQKISEKEAEELVDTFISAISKAITM